MEDRVAGDFRNECKKTSIRKTDRSFESIKVKLSLFGALIYPRTD